MVKISDVNHSDLKDADIASLRSQLASTVGDSVILANINNKIN